MGEKEVPDGSGLGLRERLGPVVDAAAGPHGRPACGPLVAKVSVGVDADAPRKLGVDGTSLTPQPIVVTRVFITFVEGKLWCD